MCILACVLMYHMLMWLCRALSCMIMCIGVVLCCGGVLYMYIVNLCCCLSSVLYVSGMCVYICTLHMYVYVYICMGVTLCVCIVMGVEMLMV